MDNIYKWKPDYYNNSRDRIYRQLKTMLYFDIVFKPKPKPFTQDFKSLDTDYKSVSHYDKIYNGLYKRNIVVDNISDSIITNLLCYCSGLLISPKILKCGHTICLSCYQNKLNCPFCNQATFANSPENIVIKNIVSNLNIICIHKECQWIGKANMLYDHLNICPMSTINCNYCKLPMHLKDFTDHKKECGDYIVDCNLCHNLGPRKLLENHCQKECYDRLVKCHQCNIDVRAGYIINNSHLCLNEKVFCQFCGQVMSFRELEYHVSNLCQLRYILCGFCNKIYKLEQYVRHKTACTQNFRKLKQLIDDKIRSQGRIRLLKID
jgi:hypothetical protein